MYADVLSDVEELNKRSTTEGILFRKALKDWARAGRCVVKTYGFFILYGL